MTGVLFDIDRYAIHDGPGIRTTIFFKGCPLNCLWCHSPESQSFQIEILFAKGRCTKCGQCLTSCPQGCQLIDGKGNRKYIRTNCQRCFKCVNACHFNALSICGRQYSVEEVVEEIKENLVFYQSSGGGVTLTGGEVLAQSRFASEILRQFRLLEIDTIVETSGFSDWSTLKSLIPFVNTFYFDIKQMGANLHKKYTGVTNQQILANLSKLRQRKDSIVIRVPLIPGHTDQKINITAIYKLASELAIKEIHLLPYNNQSSAKYDWLGKSFELANLSRQTDEYLNFLAEIAPIELSVNVIG